MPSKQERSELRRGQILQAAATVFAQLGFHKARMDDIVQEAGLSKGAVYWYFESKDELITTILEQFLEQELQNFIRISHGEGPIPDRLRIMLEGLAEEMEAISSLMPIIYEYYAVAARDQAIRKSIDQYLSQYVGLLEKLIEEGIERKELKKCQAHDVALSLVALIEGCMLIWILRNGGVVKTDLAKLFSVSISMMLEGLEVEK